MPGNHVLLLPLRDESGVVQDFEIAAASPGALDAFGRRADSLIGARLRADYGEAIRGEIWQAYPDALADGRPRTVGPFPYERTVTGLPPAWFTVSLRRVGPGMLDSWTRDDDLSEPRGRIARAERLANLGWSERDLLTETTSWSDQLYRIFERDPANLPMSEAELDAATVPADRPVRRRTAERLSAGRAVDLTYRIQVPSGIRHVRWIAESVRGVDNRPLKIVEVMQDVTARVTSGTRLARAEQQLVQQQQSLAAESRLVTDLQQIILPLPAAPIDLPGLRVAVRYLPAEQANRIGGDWYHAGPAYDGSVVIAVGDVAGHGLRAAAAMAQQRNALATLTATASSEPSELLRYLNRLIHNDDEPTGIASAVVARYDPASGTLEWAQAGHPPPLRTRDGTTAELPRPAGMMLGVVPEPVYETTSVTIRPGDVLLFYTDGLIEHRGRSPEDGLRPVIATLDRLSSRGSRQPLADLLEQLNRANPDDDTCILAIRHRAGQEPAGQEPAGQEAAGQRPVAEGPVPAPEAVLPAGPHAGGRVRWRSAGTVTGSPEVISPYGGSGFRSTPKTSP
jgi:serine phosphatase RsbU (regulator of sigma subunit)